MSQDTSRDNEEDLQLQEHKINDKDERALAHNDFVLNNDIEIAPKFDTVYEINGKIFREENRNDSLSYLEFDVQLNEYNDGATALEETETDNMYLEIISYQEINEGVIINSYIFLTLIQWNTLIVAENYKFCFVCDDVVESFEHIKMVSHMQNLERNRPLKKFDLAITRLIRESYHCAVCNVIFNKNNEKDHFDSEGHKNNMEHARNQTLELTDNGNNINDYEINDASDDDLNNDLDCNNANNGNNDIDLNNGNNVIALNNGNNVVALNNENNVVALYNGHNIIALNEIINTNIVGTVSYAEIVKRPHPSLNITFVFDNETYNMPFDHWHMIIYPRTNQFYCMTCKAFDHVSDKTAHCKDNNHSAKLSYCYFIENYQPYLIRQMFLDYKYYHCGICNKLVLISEVDHHIVAVHDENFVNRASLEASRNDEIKNTFNGRNMYNDNSNRNNQVATTSRKVIYNKITICRELMEINNTSPGLYNDIVLYQFFCKLRISFGAYNVILNSVHGLFCGVCNIIESEEVMKYHLIDFDHVARLRVVPFEAYCGLNLIRVVNNRVHCAICNIFIDNIYKTLQHVSGRSHRALLYQALRGSDPDDSINLNEQSDSNQIIDLPQINYIQGNEIESIANEVDDSIESIESYNHDFLYLHFNNKIIKVSFNAYHSLVAIGDGTTYCFVCSSVIIGCSKNHIESNGHKNELKNCKFLDKFDKHLLRQIYLVYHCSTCNVIFSQMYLNKHLTWPIPEEKTSKAIRNDINSGIKLLEVETQKEETFLNMQESKMEIIGRIDIKPQSIHVEIDKANKIIIYESTVLKLSWDSWQGILNKKNGILCILCDKVLKNFELNYHISEECHANALENTFDANYFPSLIRKVTDSTVHCLTCNKVISNKKNYILTHVHRKKHIFTYNNLRDDLSVNSYSDCNENVIYLSRKSEN